MTASVTIKPEEIHLFHIDIIESSITELPFDTSGDFDLGVVQSVMHNLKGQRVKIGLEIELKKSASPHDILAEFVIDFHFQVKNLENFYELKEDKPIFSGLLISTLMGLSFSTARGIIFERLSNANIHGVILPVINPRDLLQKKP